MKSKDLSELSYYQGIYGNHILLGNGDLVVGYRLWFPELWTSDTKKIGEIDKSLASLIKKLPDNSMTQWSYYVYDEYHRSDFEDAHNRIELEDLKSWDRKSVVRFYCELYITLSNEKLNKITETDNPLVRAKKYLFERPFKEVDEKIEEFKLVVNSITKTFEQEKYIKAVQLTGPQLLNSIKKYFSQLYDKEKLPEGFVNPDILFEDGVFKIGNEYVAIVSLVKEGDFVLSTKESNISQNGFTDVDLPTHVTLPSSMAFILSAGIPFPHIYNVGIEKVKNEDAFSALKKIKSGVKMLHYLGVGKATNIRSEIGGEKDKESNIVSNGFIDQAEAGNLQATRCRINVIIKDPNKDVLNNKIEFVNNSFRSMNETVSISENGHLQNLFFASAPGCMRFNYRAVWQTAEQSVRYLSKESPYGTDSEGLKFLDRTGKPLKINTWENEHIVARNAVVFAPTGSGKSVLLNHIVNQYVAQDYYVIIIDIGGSFKRNTLINQGFYFDAGIPENLRFNVFLCDQDKLGNYIYQPMDEEEDEEESNPESSEEKPPSRKDDQINFVASILLMIWKGKDKVSRETKAALKKTIVAFYEMVNKEKLFPDMTLYYRFLEKNKKGFTEKLGKYFDVEGIMMVLDDFVTGQYKYLLNSKDNIKMSDKKFLVFDLEAIKEREEINEIVIAIVMYNASEIINTKKSKKAYIVDEAIDYLKGDMGDFIAGLYRKIRKRNGQAIISTQGIGYLEELSPLVMKSIFGNTSSVWLLSHKEDKASYKLLKQYLDLSDGQLSMLDSVGRGDGYREVLLKMGADFCTVLRVQISEFALLSYTTKSEEVDRLEFHYQRSNSHITAIRDFMEEKSKEKKKSKEYIELEEA